MKSTALTEVLGTESRCEIRQPGGGTLHNSKNLVNGKPNDSSYIRGTNAFNKEELETFIGNDILHRI